MTIRIEQQPSAERLAALGINDWPIWKKEPSDFPWHYDAEEWCYLLAGDVTVTPDGGAPVRFGMGDLVIFPAGLSCRWTIHSAVRKHYQFR